MKRSTFLLHLLSPLVLLPAAILPGQEVDYPRLKSDAEKAYREGSYARARELYLKAPSAGLPRVEERWIAFRLADTLWRAQAGSRTADASLFEKAAKELDAQVRDLGRAEEKDRVWAEVKESLADFHWTRPDSRNFGAAWSLYQEALEWWAASKDLDEARERYLRIVWTVSSPPWRERQSYYGYYGNFVPLPILRNALAIAATENERARAHFLIAMTLRQQGGEPYDLAQVVEHFEAALKPGKSTEWYDDSLYHLAEWLESNGKAVEREDGQFAFEPDFPRALALFRRLVEEHQKGETRYYDPARSQIENITRPTLGVSVASFFIPGSEIEYQLSWRNLARIDLALYPIDLTRAPSFSREQESVHGWLQTVSVAGREKAKSWSRETGDHGEHRPGFETVRLDAPLPAGAYLLEATGGGISAREAILVTEAALVLKTSGRQALAYFARCDDGSPLAGARVRLWEKSHDGRSWSWRDETKETDPDGLARFELPDEANSSELFAAAIMRDAQAFAIGGSSRHRPPGGEWRIYAITDRPAYRPGEKAEWKIIARRRDGGAYSTPAGQSLEYQIVDPRGAKVSEGKALLNEFGSAWGSLALTESMPLGEYHIQFWSQGRKANIGGAQLLRLEEYKLPEFRVSIETPLQDGKRRLFRLGEIVEASISAQYFFGGAVADAQVEVIVHQQPYWFYWSPERQYPWYYEDLDQRPWYGGGGGQIVKRETLRTDSTGAARVLIETPRGGGQDLEYRIEARVVDSSRREVVSSSSVRVTRSRYAVHPRAEHNLYRPGDTVKVDFKALDANGNPVEVEGQVRVTRDRWREIWIGPDGKEADGDALRSLGVASPLLAPGTGGHRLKFRGYEHEEILSTKVKTKADGAGELSFAAAREGYYRIAWRSDDAGGPAVKAETTVWAATPGSSDIGYRHGALGVIADRDTFRVGSKAPVMLTVPVAGRYVLFSVEGEELFSYRLVKMEGTVKLLEVDVEERHVPNIVLGAAMLSDRELHQEQVPIVVPPTKNFLTVEVKGDRAEYLPREEGTLSVTARDSDGKPVAAEVALSLMDESVLSIQREYAGDPRQFFFGEKRPHQVQTQSTLDQKRFARLQKEQKLLLADGNEEEDAPDLGQSYGRRYKEDRGGDRKDLGFRTLLRAKLAAPSAARAEGLRRGAALAGNLALDAAAPAAAAEGTAQGGGGVGGGEEEGAVMVRNDFRSTVLWEPGVKTGADGKASVKVKFPDSLTSWKASARAVTAGSQFGVDSSSVRTRLPLIVRLQAPRFFVAGDSVTISAVINNNTEKALAVSPLLEAEGLSVRGFLREGKTLTGPHDPVTVPPNGEARGDWIVTAESGGTAKIRVTARAGKLADAMERSYPVHEHGIEKLLARSGKLRGNTATVKLDLPPRKAGSTSLVVQVTPSLAVTMLDSLPYLLDYPYGCVEQTMSRFLPAAIVKKTLRDRGIDPAVAMERLFGGIEPETAEKTHPEGKKDLRRLEEVVQKGLERLYDFQHADGGWGWWKGGESDPFMTAYVVWGLVLARGADLDVRPAAIDRGADFLAKALVGAEENPDLAAWMLHALAAHHADRKKGSIGGFEAKAFQKVWEQRDALNAYTRALLALAAKGYGDSERAKTLVENLENGVKRDSTPDVSVVIDGKQTSQEGVQGTAHWGEDGIFWRWSDGGVEATAFALRAILAIDPANALVEPVTNWLIKNRRGAQWSNTRDTAIALLALNDYLARSGELAAEGEYEVIVNGERLASRRISPAEAFSAPSRFIVPAERVKDGLNEIRIARKGNAPLYFACEARFFSLEEPVKAAGSEVFLRRDYERLSLRPTLLKGLAFEKAPLLDEGKAESGERISVAITIEAKNNLDYLIVEDLKPAGLEAVELRSGAGIAAREIKSAAFDRLRSGGAGRKGLEPEDFTGRTRWVYQELRDRKVASFIDHLPQGVWELRYELRAEVPGRFHGLPAMAHAMYVPEIRGNSDEIRLEIQDVKVDPTVKLRRAFVGN